MQQIKRKKLYEDVITGILGIVKTEGMNPGDKLQSVEQLSELFGVSRTVIREALTVLQSNDYVEVRHGSGIYLKNSNSLEYSGDLEIPGGKRQILNMLEFRKGLESEAAYMVALRSSQQDRENLRRVIEAMFDAISTRGYASEEDYRFHTILINACQNPVYIKVFNEIIKPNYYEVLNSSQQFFAKTFGPRFVIVKEHENILNLIDERKADKARQAMWQHLDNVEAKLRNLFQLQ
ncbi:MAG: FadR/GntR family transcriptional regulator [Negativicutes bacterium]|nr:FadR/GntR family transcriptional regulator [Negativicutes bacterium]